MKVRCFAKMRILRWSVYRSLLRISWKLLEASMNDIWDNFIYSKEVSDAGQTHHIPYTGVTPAGTCILCVFCLIA